MPDGSCGRQATMSKHQIAHDVAIQACRDLYKPDWQTDMQPVAAIIGMTAIEAYLRELRNLNRKKADG